MQCICIISPVVPEYLITCRLMSVTDVTFFHLYVYDAVSHFIKLLQDAWPLFEEVKKIFLPSDTI